MSRKNYLISYGIAIAVGLVAGLASNTLFPNGLTNIKGVFALLLFLSPLIYIGHCITVKRLHDLDRPASDIWLINRSWTLHYRLLLEEGTQGRNQYGYPQNPPKAKSVRY